MFKWIKYGLIIGKSMATGSTIVNFGKHTYAVAGNTVKKIR